MKTGMCYLPEPADAAGNRCYTGETLCNNDATVPSPPPTPLPSTPPTPAVTPMCTCTKTTDGCSTSTSGGCCEVAATSGSARNTDLVLLLDGSGSMCASGCPTLMGSDFEKQLRAATDFVKKIEELPFATGGLQVGAVQPVGFLQNTFSDRTRCIAQLRPGSSFLLSALRFLDRFSPVDALERVATKDPTYLVSALTADVASAKASIEGAAYAQDWTYYAPGLVACAAFQGTLRLAGGLRVGKGKHPRREVCTKLDVLRA